MHLTHRVFEDLVEVLEPGDVLDLRDDLHVLAARLIQDFADEYHVVGALHERRRHVVHLVLAAEVLQVVDVLLGEHGDLHLHAGQVAVLALPELLRVEDPPLELVRAQDLHHLDHDAAVRDQDPGIQSAQCQRLPDRGKNIKLTIFTHLHKTNYSHEYYKRIPYKLKHAIRNLL